MAKNKTVSIKFSQGSYRLLKNYPFRPAGVFAELIDNSIQSYENNKTTLTKQSNYKLKIVINFKGEDIVISDNAAGISDENMTKAFEPGAVVKGKRGLNEFGIGMKNAAVWISNNYTVITKAINEAYSKKVDFDYDDVISKGTEELEIKYLTVKKENPFTEITLRDLRDSVEKFRFAEIRKELSSIYRQYIASGEILISFFGEDLKYNFPKELNAAYYPDTLKQKQSGGNKPPVIKWKFEINQPYLGKKVTGFVGILGKIKKNENGISYFKNGRVIEGAGDLKLFPKALSGTSGSHQYKRIYGELHLNDYDTDLSKSKFIDTEDIEILLNLVAHQLKNYKPKGSNKTYDLLKQARDLRLDSDVDVDKVIQRLKLNEKKKQKASKVKEKKAPVAKVKFKSKVSEAKKSTPVKIEAGKAIHRIIDVGDTKYSLTYTVKFDTNTDDLYSIVTRGVKAIGEKPLINQGISKVITGTINLNSTFLKKYTEIAGAKTSDGFYELILFMMVSEAEISSFPKVQPHYFREYLNEIIGLNSIEIN